MGEEKRKKKKKNKVGKKEKSEGEKREKGWMESLCDGLLAITRAFV